MKSKPPQVPRRKDELLTALAEQMKFLHTSSRLYDEGEPWEAKRLATTIRTYTIDPEISVTEGRPSVVLRWKPLTEIVENVDFNTWWTGTVAKAGNRSFTRWDFVKGPANQDGGAHVDPGLDAAYAELSRGDIGGVVSLHDDSVDVYTEAHNNPVLAAVRTIAFELFVTLDQQMMDFIPTSQGGRAEG